MIGNKNKPEVTSGGLHNTLSIGTEVKGNIVLDIDFRLDGQVEGDIKCGGKIVLGPKAVVKGNIESVNAEISGVVIGSVHATEKLIIRSTANIKGDVYTQVLEIEPNAKLNGACNMTQDKLKK